MAGLLYNLTVCHAGGGRDLLLEVGMQIYSGTAWSLGFTIYLVAGVGGSSQCVLRWPPEWEKSGIFLSTG